MAPAPIVFFAFARSVHTRRSLEALAANSLADQSDLIIYADAARTAKEVNRVQEVRALLRGVSGFRTVTLIERETNFGLARNIIKGVTEVCNQYGRVIVLEDDIVTSPNFLTFINTALDRYVNEPRVWHISGWNYPIDPEGLDDAFFWRVMNCWGWATWADRWQHYRKEPHRLIQTWTKDNIKRFNLDGGHDFWSQVTANQAGKLNTWAIFWYATIFEHNGLCLNPARTFAHNIGHDGSGENCGGRDPFIAAQFACNIKKLPDIFDESELAVQKIKACVKCLPGRFSPRIVQHVKMLLGVVRRNG